MFTLLCAISIQILKFFCKDRRLLLYMSRTLHLFGTDWCAMMVPIQVIRWYRMQCYDGTDSCAIVVPIRRYCHYSLFQSTLSKRYEEVVYRHRNRCAHNTLSYQVNKPDFSVLASTDFSYHSYFFRFALIVLIDEIFMVLFRKYVSLQN